MGLDFSHGDAHWSYSGFGRFRNRIAKEAGFPEYEIIVTTDDPRYSKISGDPILHLLAHSDCDGHLTPEQCIELAPRLKEIVEKWPNDDFDKIQALRLIEGMLDSAADNENLEFT